MNKYIKIFSTLLTTGVIFTVTPANVSILNISVQQNQAYAEELSKEEIVKKFYTNFSEAKSFMAKTDTTYTGQGENMIFKIESPTIKGSKDFSMSGYLSLADDETMKGNFSIYKKDDISYVNIESITGTAWMKTTDSSAVNEVISFKDISEFFETKELFKTYNDKISVTEKDGKYEISTKADVEAYRLFEKKLLKFSDDPTPATQPNITDGKITFTVDKESFNVESLDFSIKIEENNEAYSVKSNSTLSDINKVSEITLPEGTKFAIDADSMGISSSLIGS